MVGKPPKGGVTTRPIRSLRVGPAVLAVASIVKRLKLAPEAARSSYPSHANVWEDVPYVRKESVQAILDAFPKETLKNVTPEKFIDNSLLKELEDSGFVSRLYRK